MKVQGVVTDKSGDPVPGVLVNIEGADIMLKATTDLEGNYSLNNVPENAELIFSYIGMENRKINVANRTEIHVIMGDEEYNIAGTVQDAATGKPLPGVNINVAGIASAITEDDGSYSIKLPSKNAILEISGFGYARKEISVQGRTRIDLKLYESGYKGAQKTVYTPTGDVSSTQIANSWSVIKENSDLSVAITPDGLIQGYAGGVNTVFRSGMPGTGANMYLHGFNTMNAGAMPLFIVDGLPYENSVYASSLIDNYAAHPLASIDVKDIESITILKDGTSLYGVKGANGVILIKTLRANQMETKINAHLHTGISFEPDRIPVLNAAEHRNLLSDILQNRGISPSSIESLPYFNSELPVKQPWGYEGNIDYYRYNHDTDWQRQIYNSKWSQNYYLSVAGGDETAKYVLSLGYTDQQGTLKNTRFQRFNTRFNSEIKLSPQMNFSSNMSFIYGNKNLMNEGADAKRNPMLASLLKAPFTTTHVYNEEGRVSPNEEPADVFGNSNPYVLVNNLLLAGANYRFMGTFELGWHISDHFSLSGSLGLNFNKERERVFYPGVGIAFDPVNSVPVTNEMQHRTDRLFSLYGDVHADYRAQLASAHRLNVRIGTRYQNNRAENDFGKAYNSSSDDFKTIGYGIALLRQIGGSIGNWNWLSFYASADYALQNKYFLTLSLASDASSRYGKDAATLFSYPSVAAAWLLSGEECMQNAPVFDLLKLRVSYGLSGNDDIGNYNGIQYYRPQNLLGNYGLVRGNLVNTGLKPETVERINAGIDLSFFNERVNVSADVYASAVKNMILVTTPDRISGFDRYIANAGSMRNTGVDCNLNTRILNGTFKWDTGLTVSTYKNKVSDLGGEEFLTEIYGATVQTKVGQPLGVFYGYQTDGVYSTQAEADNAGLHVLQGLVEVNFGAGDVHFVNQNGDRRIDENDRTVIGDPNPDLFGSIANTFRYKQWSLNALMTYSLGNDVYNYTRAQLENLSTYNNQSKAVLNRWRYEGDRTNVPKASYADPMGNARFSDRWIEDGSYIRLKSLTLAYDFNINWKLLQNCTVFATGENLVTLTKYKGLDPEFALGQNPLYYGIDPCAVPQIRTVSIGIKLAL
ncbi:MAG: SusC/RagA family TonB-linked outer membrane protein [Tannerella sp.]|jgi:TonB-linked SusC/RagA family outer membrane protein|nr:SusC/RagA family TonB-linked outer membrane protein [Tannerella sp.]